jgi:predicted nucleic acid-binding protein
MADAPDATGSVRFVLDCSVALSWCFPDEAGGGDDPLLASLADGEAVVPPLWFLELSNALRVARRRGRVSEPEVAEAMRLLGALPIRMDERSGFPLATDLLNLSARWNLSAYDAAYLELANRLSLPLATHDRRLQEAAGRAGIALQTGW